MGCFTGSKCRRTTLTASSITRGNYGGGHSWTSPSSGRTPRRQIETCWWNSSKGQPSGVRSVEDPSLDYPTITKDLHKLWAEPSLHGRCMFHICQAADSGRFSVIKDKYNAATQNALSLASETRRQNLGAAQDETESDDWLVLLILVLHQRLGKTGSYLHRAKWDGSRWAFIGAELLSPATTARVQP